MLLQNKNNGDECFIKVGFLQMHPNIWPLSILLASFPSSCYFHLPVHLTGIMLHFLRVSNTLRRLPLPCGYSWLPVPFHSIVLNPIVPPYLSHGISLELSIISPSFKFGSFYFHFSGSHICLSECDHYSFSPCHPHQQTMVTGTMTVYFASPLPRMFFLAPKETLAKYPVSK